MQNPKSSENSGSLSYSNDAIFYVTSPKFQKLDQERDPEIVSPDAIFHVDTNPQHIEQEIVSPDDRSEILSQKQDIVRGFCSLFFYKFFEFSKKKQIQKHPKLKIIKETLPKILLEIPSLEKIQLVSSKFQLLLLCSGSRSTLGPSCFLAYNPSEASLDDCLGGIIRLLILSLSNPEMIQPGPHMLSCRLSLLIELQELAIENRKQDDLLPPVSIEEFDAALNMLEGLLEKITDSADSGKQEARVKLDKLKSIFWKDQSYWNYITHALKSAWKWLLSCLAFPKKLEVPTQPPLKSGSVDQEDGSLGVSSSGKESTDCAKTAGKEPIGCEETNLSLK